MKRGGKEKQESEEPEEPGPRSERVQSRLPPRYPGEINGKREAAGEGRRGRTRCEEVRLDEEDRGPGEKGRPGNRQGRRRLCARGLGRSRLPSRRRSAPPLSPAPTPLAYPAPEAGQGKYPPRGLLVPEQVWQTMHSQNPGVHPRPVPTISPASPPDAPPDATRTRIAPLMSPNQGPGSQGTLTQWDVHPRGLNGQSMHKGEALQGRFGAMRHFP